ncbi:flagellar hook-associated protein FlgL [Candidatus Magnetominusculus dajiuhuensis]|uniref:flagellar hook-associated protein FlgL n=1 Tax=Candidatus Magnetominusculus dajiuhuensis TaxID=3137712 RepID=UPI003B42EF27
MRISSFMYIDMMRKSFQDDISQLYGSQQQLSSGLKINRPSDDISGMGQILGYKVDIANTDQYQRNINNAQSILQTSDTAMSSVVTNLQRVQELMVSGASGQTDAAGRQDTASEIATIRDSLYALSLTRSGGSYLFSGSLTNAASFATSPVPLASTGGLYSYRGDDSQISVNVNSTAKVIENITGSDAFAFSLKTTVSIKLTTGNFAHFTPSTGSVPSLITLNLSTSSVPTAQGFEQASFSNYMDMTNIIVNAFNNNDVDMINAMMDPLQKSLDKVVSVRATIGARLNFLQQTQTNNDNNSVNMAKDLSNVQDSDITQTTSDISKSEMALQALRQSSGQVMSQTLFDFITIK